MTEQSKLEDYADDDSPIEAAAIRVLSAAISKGKRHNRILTGCIAVLTVITLLTGYTALSERNLAKRVQAGSISQCEAGNEFRAANVTTWKFFIAILIKGDNKPKDIATAKRIIQFIEAQNMPRDCQAIYGAAPPL